MRVALQPYHRLVVHFLNIIFGTTSQSEAYWHSRVSVDIESKFSGVRFSAGASFKQYTAYVDLDHSFNLVLAAATIHHTVTDRNVRCGCP